MKKKYFFVILFLILAIFLVGCNGVVTPATDEAKVKNTIQNYALALNDQDWNEARSYCVYGSDAYYNVSVKEDIINVLYMYCSVVTLTYYVDIINVDINGNYATAYVHTTFLITACGYAESDDTYQYVYLQKIGNSWKIYDSS